MKFEDVKVELAKMSAIKAEMIEHGGIPPLDKMAELERTINTIVEWVKQYAPDGDADTIAVLADCEAVLSVTRFSMKWREAQQ
jgi:hypothetical protein